MMHPREQEREEKYRKARAKVESMRGFYSHLFFFLFINAGLLLLNYIASPGLWWFYWPLTGWGLGLIAHFISVFVLPAMFGPEWEDRQIRKMMGED